MSRLRPVVRLAAVAGTCVGLLLSTVPLASAHGIRERTFADERVVELTGAADQSGGTAGLEYHQTHADEVTATNLAVAHTTCDGCRAVALSFQVVVVDRGPTSLDVSNLALALNESCTGCESLAVAYQLVVATDDRAWLAGAGHGQLAQLRRELRALAWSEAPLEEIQASADALMAETTAAVSANLRVRPEVRRDHDLQRTSAPPRVNDHEPGSGQDPGDGTVHARVRGHGRGADRSDA